MSDEIVFYHNPQSRAAMVHAALEEAGAPYRVVDIRFDQGDNRTPEFLAINPMGKIPVIVHRGTTITEAPAIIAYLADAFPDAGLAPPPDSPERGAYYRWLFFGGSCFEPALLDTMLKRPPIEQKGMVGWGSYDDVIDALEVGLATGPWLLGERFSAADLYIGAQLSWATSFGAPRLKESKIIADYVARYQARPGVKRAADADQQRIAAAKA